MWEIKTVWNKITEKYSVLKFVLNSLLSTLISVVVIMVLSSLFKMIEKLLDGNSFQETLKYVKENVIFISNANYLIYIVLGIIFVSIFLISFHFINRKNPIINELDLSERDADIAFEYNLAKVFPGQRGLVWYESKEAVRRLNLMFRNNVFGKFWKVRGNLDASIDSFQILSKKKVLIDYEELVIKRIAVSKNKCRKKSFIYVEVLPESPTGLYDLNIENGVNICGYAIEEYGLFGKKKVTRREYDDGSAIINGRVTEIPIAKLRVRYLTDCNFIIMPQNSLYFSIRFRDETTSYFNKLINGEISHDDFFSYLESY